MASASGMISIFSIAFGPLFQIFNKNNTTSIVELALKLDLSMT